MAGHRRRHRGVSVGGCRRPVAQPVPLPGPLGGAARRRTNFVDRRRTQAGWRPFRVMTPMRAHASDLSPTIDAPDTAVPDAAPPRVRSVMRLLPLPLTQSLLIALALFVMCDGWQRDFRVPLGFVSDSLWYLAQAKSTVDSGWWWWNPRLGAPYGLDEVSFPSNSTVDQAVVWVVSRFVTDAFAAI